MPTSSKPDDNQDGGSDGRGTGQVHEKPKWHCDNYRVAAYLIHALASSFILETECLPTVKAMWIRLREWFTECIGARKNYLL